MTAIIQGGEMEAFQQSYTTCVLKADSKTFANVYCNLK